jgi:hypothetical protein
MHPHPAENLVRGRSMRQAAAIGPVPRPLLARSHRYRRHSGSGVPAGLHALRCRAGPRGAGRMRGAAGHMEGWLLAGWRGLEWGGDSCLGPLGLL